MPINEDLSKVARAAIGNNRRDRLAARTKKSERIKLNAFMAAFAAFASKHPGKLELVLVQFQNRPPNQSTMKRLNKKHNLGL